jgi:hypothetical protein
MSRFDELTPAQLLEALQEADTDIDLKPWQSTYVGLTIGHKDYAVKFDEEGNQQSIIGYDGGTERALSQKEEVKVDKTIAAILLRFEGN